MALLPACFLAFIYICYIGLTPPHTHSHTFTSPPYSQRALSPPFLPPPLLPLPPPPACCRIRDAQICGVNIEGAGTHGRLEGCDITGNEETGVDINEGAYPTLAGCK